MADSSNYITNKTFDPSAQQFEVLAPDGQTQVVLNLSDINLVQTNTTAQGIIYGIQIGLCSLLLVTLMLTTKPDKRRSPVFLLNGLALLLLLIRNILSSVELTNMFYNFYNYELSYYPSGSALRHAMGVSIAAELFAFFVTAVIYFSMILQIHIVCCTLMHWQKQLVVLGCAFVALVALALRLTVTIVNIDWLILGINTTQDWQEDVFQQLASANKVVTVITIGLYSCVFVAKLASAIVLRRKLRMKQFGPMQIIFIMGCQTLFVPLIFAIITYYAIPGIQINSFVLTVVAIFLPLSGIWASANTAQHKAAADVEHLPRSGSNYDSTKAFATYSDGSRTKNSDTTQASTLIGDQELFIMSRDNITGKADDLEKQMQQVRDGHIIDVSRTFSVRTDRHT